MTRHAETPVDNIGTLLKGSHITYVNSDFASSVRLSLSLHLSIFSLCVHKSTDEKVNAGCSNHPQFLL